VSDGGDLDGGDLGGGDLDGGDLDGGDLDGGDLDGGDLDGGDLNGDGWGAGDGSADEAVEEEVADQAAARPASDRPRVALDLGGAFDWEGDGALVAPKVRSVGALGEADDDGDDDGGGGGDDDEDQTEASKAAKKSKRAKKRAREAAEAQIAAQEQALLSSSAAPQSAEDYDRLLIANPNNSFLWISFMALHMSMDEIDQARAVAERALKSTASPPPRVRADGRGRSHPLPRGGGEVQHLGGPAALGEPARHAGLADEDVCARRGLQRAEEGAHAAREDLRAHAEVGGADSGGARGRGDGSPVRAARRGAVRGHGQEVQGEQQGAAAAAAALCAGMGADADGRRRRSGRSSACSSCACGTTRTGRARSWTGR
jgi:hypothetical protein